MVSICPEDVETPAEYDITTFDDHLEYALQIVEKNLERYRDSFPSADTGPDLQYRHWPVEDWTPSFWTGMCWLGYELTGEDAYREVASGHLSAYEARVEQELDVDFDAYEDLHEQSVTTHDLGFVYTLSAIAQHRLTGEERPRQVALRAADYLADRFHEECGLIQAHGNPNDPEDDHYGHTIIDCLMNLPLLLWASQETGYDRYHDIAATHARTTAQQALRENGSTLQNQWFDPETGEVLEAQPGGDYCWSRGQSWGIYGFALAYRYTGDPAFRTTAKRTAEYYLENTPGDHVPRWDFSAAQEHARDTAAASIGACGLFELAAHLPEADPDMQRYRRAALDTLYALGEYFATDHEENAEGILTESSYTHHGSREAQTDNATIFGDYYYLEGLTRARTDWMPYW